MKFLSSGKSGNRRETTYGSKLVENVCQAIAGDILVNGILKASERGYEIFSLIHDEALAHNHPDGIEGLNEALCDAPDWLVDFPLVAEGDLVRSYRK